MYKMVGNLPEKDMAMLEERIKRVSKTRGPPAPLAAAQPPPAATREAASSHNGGQPSVHPSSPERQQPNSGIPGPKSSSSGMAAPTRIKNFRQLQPPGIHQTH